MNTQKAVNQSEGFLKAEWCEGGHEGGHEGEHEKEVLFADDFECSCGVEKHHYHCPICGKIVQVG